MNVENAIFPLKKLDGLSLNGFTLHFGDFKQLRLSGWKGFKLYIQNKKGKLSIFPVIKGIYSAGAKHGVKPWLDVEYREELEFPSSETKTSKLLLNKAGQDRLLFKLLGDIIPPGGHLMVSYEGEQKIHEETMKSLSIGIPPAATPLGYLIYQAGFQYIKDWYLAEGGSEGPRKLWGEKAPDEAWKQNFLEKTYRQLRSFLGRKPTSYKELENSARQRAEEILSLRSYGGVSER